MKKNILETIGNTPLVRLNHFQLPPKVTLALKLEGNNPAGSVKDRVAKYMIEGAEKRGELVPGRTIIEPTSGNTGIGLALVAAYKGYRLVVTMPENMSLERRSILKAMGAEVILTPAEKGTDGAIEKARALCEAHPEIYYMPNQFDNWDNVRAHYETTAPEIWEQTEGRVTHFVAGMGTTGTLMGVSQKLRELNPAVNIIGVEPFPGHKLQGLKNMEEAIIPKIYNPSLLNRVVRVADADAFNTVELLAKREGIFAGYSTGAALFAALNLARELEEGLVVVLSPDRGDRYLSTINISK
ncbi:MAG TPA: cysteine synthase family protein [Bacillota bacterium]|nr:cysteine synthase family protein [Bacillota bacterium]